MAFNCRPTGTFSCTPAVRSSSVTRSRVKKYIRITQGKISTAKMLITRIHLLLSTPITGITSMGISSVTIMPVPATLAMLLNTLSCVRCMELRLAFGTSRLLLIKNMVKATAQ